MNNQYIFLGLILVFIGYFAADHYNYDPLWGVGGGVAFTLLADHFKLLEKFTTDTTHPTRH
jgi:hypothetical protein